MEAKEYEGFRRGGWVFVVQWSFLEPGWQILQFSTTDRFERAVEPAVYRSEQLYEREQQTGNR